MGSTTFWGHRDIIHRAGVPLDCFGGESNIFQYSKMSFTSISSKEEVFLFYEETTAT